MVIFRIVIIIILLVGSLFLSPGTGSAFPEELLAPAWSPLIITSPTTLSPMPDPQDPLCQTYWYIFNSSDGYPAYLTLNVSNPEGSTNSGEWRPNIPTNGFYKIEVYIPIHGVINWSCVPGLSVSGDTTQARYTISSPTETKVVAINQAVNAGKWVSLGTYQLSQGIGNALMLNDITGENSSSTTVSFSMARFTWVSEARKTYLPLIYNNFDQASLTKVKFDNVVPLAREGISRTRYDLDEPITYRLSGTNGYTASETTRLTWQYLSPCGYSPESEKSLLVPVGSWTYDLVNTISGCPGGGTAIIRIYSRGAMLQKTVSLTIDGGGTLQLFRGPAFDVCQLPSVEAMRAWWTSSPYSVVNIYMGGISFASGCNYSGMSRDWIKNVQNIGWGFIPTWVGPQAPCSDLKYKFSFDTALAYEQGKQEAQLAATKAIQLGLVRANNNDTILFYDMEGYSYAKNAVDQAVRNQCKLAVKEFLRGWTEQLHASQMLAGAYGGALSSYMADWWTISPRLDMIWAARWNKDFYDPLASVYGLGFSDDYWNPNLRVRQYAGDHYETWGGRQIAIDSDVADATLLLPRFPIVKPPVAADQGLFDPAAVTDFQLLTSQQGWLIDKNSLYWTDDGGLSWRLISVPMAESSSFEKGFFLSSTEGWVLASTDVGFSLLSTKDGGVSWQATALPDNGPVDPLSFEFQDSQLGEIKFRFQTSQAFREGFTLITTDAGATWLRTELSQDDPAWQPIQPAQGQPPVPEGTIQVDWFSATQGWAGVFRGVCTSGGDPTGSCQSAVVLMSTTDGGETWVQIYP